MYCKKCNVHWKLGTQNEEVNVCPVCGTIFAYDCDMLGIESMEELLQVLILLFGIEVLQEKKRIYGYLNDYFPEQMEKREHIRVLFEAGLCQQLIKWSRYHVDVIETQAFLANCIPYKQIPSDEKLILAILALFYEQGTNLSEVSFYIQYAKQTKDKQYQQLAYEKALCIKEDDELSFELAKLELEQNDEKAVQRLDALAKGGHKESILLLAHLYEKGKLVKADRMRAIWYLKFGESFEDGEILYQLGRFYYLSKKRHFLLEAIQYFERAAKKDNAKACYYLYAIYYNIDNSEEKEIAMRYLKQAADLKNINAMYEYALHLFYGDDIKKDVEQALQLIQICANAGKDEASAKLAYLSNENKGNGGR